MIKILEYIWDFIRSIGNLIVNTVKTLIEALTFMPNFITSLQEAISYLPGILGVFAAIYLVFIIINYIIGRQG